MAASITLYNHTALRIADATNILLSTGTFKVTLHTSSYTPSAAHAVYADATNELATAFGYTAGGLTLAGVTLTTVTTNDAMFDANDAVWTASGGSIPVWRYAIIRRSDTVNSLVGPLIGYILGDTTPADIPATTTGNTLTLQWNASGIVTGTVA
jgi:hypothetical protein